MDKELHIIESAFAVFSKKGIVDSSVDDIAKYAGVSKKTIYFIFKSKDHLIEKTFAWKMKNVSAGVDEVINMEIPVIEKMSAYIDKICESIESISMKTFKDLAKKKILSAKAANEYLKKAVFVRFNKILEQAREEGLLKPGIQMGDALMNYWNMLSPFLLIDFSTDIPIEIKSASSLSQAMRKQLVALYRSILNEEGNNQLDQMIQP